MDIESFQWEEPELHKVPYENALTYNKDLMITAKTDRVQKNYADLNRICEIEDAIVEWYEPSYFQRFHKMSFNFDYLKKVFQIKKIEFAGFDQVTAKIHLVANQIGK